MPARALYVRPDVADAVAAGRAVVALESTLFVHGLPQPDNADVGLGLEALVREHGAVAATVGVVAGVATVGLDEAGIARLAASADVPKLSLRDVPVAVASGTDGATTVAATAVLAARTGIATFATGGLGGVHLQARDTWDESPDLVALARTPITVVCSGVKSILDTGATLERLETLGVTVLGYGTRAFAGFYLTESGHELDWQVDTPAEVAAVVRAAAALALPGRATVVANPLPHDEQLDPETHRQALAQGMAEAQRLGIRGKDVTPFLLESLHRATGGASLEANIGLVRRNATLAAEIAVALADRA